MKSSLADMIHTSSDNLLNKNISSYNSSLRSKVDTIQEQIPISHYYIKQTLSVSNLEDYRYSLVSYDYSLITNTNEYLTEEEREKRYSNEEDEIYCGRFPHLSYCGCVYPCCIILSKISPIKINDLIYCGPIESAYKTKELLSYKINYVLNVSCMAYNRRVKYFKYLDIYISDNHTENAIKFFKITNRFIEDAIRNNQKILIHSVQGKSRCWVFLMAYLIGKEKFKYAAALEYVRDKFAYAEPNDNFLTQLKHYDLEMNT